MDAEGLFEPWERTRKNWGECLKEIGNVQTLAGAKRELA